MNDIMIDLETLDTGHNAAIIAIGAVLFDPMSGGTGAEFYIKIDPKDAKEFGTSSRSTLEWWARQSVAARDEAFSGVTLSSQAAYHFREFLSRFPKAKVWGNGSSFDITILESFFMAHAMTPAWEFWNIRDVRTIVDIGERSAGIFVKGAQFQGMAHKALDDAKHQAHYVSVVYRELRKTH